MSVLALCSRKVEGLEVRLTRNIKVRALDTHLREPIVSFCFDDFPQSALAVGGGMLRERGWAGTFYAAGRFCGACVDGIQYYTAEDLQRADEEGHEIGCHTYSHLRLAHQPRNRVLDDLERNRDFIDRVLPGYRPSSFAYPFGDVRLPQKIAVSRQFGVCRGIWPGLNRGRMDFGELKALPLGQDRPNATEIMDWIDRAVQAKAWLIFFTHDVSDRPTPYGYRSEDFERLLDAVARRNIKVLPMKSAVGLARFPNGSSH